MKYVNLLVTLYQFNRNARNGNCKQKGCSCACKNICMCTLIFLFVEGVIEFYKRIYFVPLQELVIPNGGTFQEEMCYCTGTFV